MLWHRESARHHWRECSDLHLQWQTKWAWTPVSSDVHSNKGLSKGWPLKVLYFGTYPVPASFGTCHQPATQECQVLTIKQMDKCLHLFIFSVIMFILPALWFFTLSRSSPLFLIMFPDLNYKERIEEVWLRWLHRVIIYGVACTSVMFWMLFLHSLSHSVFSNLLHVIAND